MKRATFKFVILFTFIFSIQNNLIAQDLTDREKADIQFQLNSFFSLADNEAVEVEYEPESDVVKSVEVKQSYKSKLQTLEGIASPTSNSYRVVDYIEFGNKKNNKVEIKLNFEGVDMMNTYSISSTYSFESKKFDNPEDIFAYMCLAKREGWTQSETIENQQSQNSSIDTAENQTTQINTTAENIDKQTQNTTNTTLKYIILSVLGICFICYIIALIRTRQEKMITIVNWYDFILLVLPFLLIIISLFIAKTHNAIFITLLVIACLSFISSMAWSIFANKDSVFNHYYPKL